MSQVCIDNEVALDFLKGDRATIEKLRYYADNEDICITSFSLLQLLTGIKKPEVVEQFVDNVVVLPFDKVAAQLAPQLIKEVKENGLNINLDGILTASICLANEVFLFTKDRKKYEGIKRLKLV